MIGPADERPKHGAEAHQDAVTVELCDLERGVCALLRLVRSVDAGDPVGMAMVCVDGEPVAAVDGSTDVRLDVVEPLARWTARFRHEDVLLEAELEADSPPIDFDDTAGLRRYEQMCHARGELRAEGRTVAFEGVGRRAHAWGEPAAARFRSLWAIAGDRALTLTAVRPLDAADHAQEQIAAYLVRPDLGPERLEQARLSTVYDAAGRPRTAGVELFVAGEEYPHRASGEAVCEAVAMPLQAACFRWSLDGRPAQGGYQVGSPA